MDDEDPPPARDLIAIPAVLAGAWVDLDRVGGDRRREGNVSHDSRPTT